MTDQLLASLVTGFRNDKHRDQWKMTLTEYAAPLRRLRVDEIGTEHVLSVLTPIWGTKNETASRLRGRIERVLDAASAKGFRRDANPARWKGHLDHLLPARPKKHLRGHHAALPVDALPAFMERLRSLRSVSARALEFCILTAARSGEVTGMDWSEVDLEKALWTIPAARMKAGREHRVPLSERALEILQDMKKLGGRFVFPGSDPAAGLSNMSMTMVVRRMGVETTVHGFRSTVRDWAGDRTDFAREVAEAALAHVVGDETERAYRRSDALEKRRALMDSWADYVGLGSPPKTDTDGAPQ
jgi:integrase